MIENRNEIVKKGETEIAYIDNELVYPKRDNIDNYIVLPILFSVFFLLIIVNLFFKIKR
jgi:hypothetical protein